MSFNKQRFKTLANSKNNTIQALWIGIGSLSSFTLGLISAAILSRYFSKQDYGTYRQILYVYNTLLVIFSAGLPSVYSYFLPRYTLSKGRHIVNKITQILFFLGLSFSICLYLFSSEISSLLNNTELELSLKLFSPIPMLLLPTLGIEGVLSSYRMSIYIAIYNLITKAFTLSCIIIPIVIFHKSYKYAIYGWVIGSVISLFIAYLIKGIPFKRIISENSDLSLKEIFKYCLPLVSASFAGIVIKSADQFFISRYFGAEIFAEYANGFIQLPFVGMITSASVIVLTPLFSKMIYEKCNTTDILAIWQSAIIKSAVTLFPIILFFIAFADTIIEILYSKEYIQSIIYFRIGMSVNFFNIIVFSPLLLALNKTKIYSRINIFLAIIIWTFGFLIVTIFNSPILIAVSSVSVGILTIIFFTIYTANLLKVRFIDIFPINKLLPIILHSMVILTLLKLLEFLMIINVTALLKLSIMGIFYSSILLISAKFLNINYFVLIKSLIDNNLKNSRNASHQTIL
jgi:O-antigen/teichoic acid export membrane protein